MPNESCGARGRAALGRRETEARVKEGPDEQALVRSLSRARAALASSRRSQPLVRRQGPFPGPAASALGAAAMALFVLAFATDQHWLLVLALVLAAGGATLFAVPAAQQILWQLMGRRRPTRAKRVLPPSATGWRSSCAYRRSACERSWALGRGRRIAAAHLPGPRAPRARPACRSRRRRARAVGRGTRCAGEAHRRRA